MTEEVRPTTDAEGWALLAALAEELQRWDGSRTAALELRRRTQALPPLRGAGRNPAEKLLLRLHAAYPGRAGLGDPGRYATETGELARLVGPFLGDPALGDWPWHEPLTLDDGTALAWLPLVGGHAAVDERVRRFVAVLFRCRRRALWTAASRAFAALARRDPGSRQALAAAWRRCFPDGLPTAWDRTLRGTKRREVPVDAHTIRHVLHAACCFVAQGGAPEELGAGPDAGRLAALPLPADAADGTALLGCFAALCAAPTTRAALLPHLAARIGETADDEGQEAALRELGELLHGDPQASDALQLLALRLSEPRWQAARGTRRLELLWSWLESAAWFVRQGDPARAEQLAAAAGEATDALRLQLHGVLPAGAPGAVEAVLARLPAVLDPDVRATTPQLRRAPLFAELLLLLGLPEVRGLSWPGLVARALPRETRGPAAPAGSVAEAAAASLALALDPEEGLTLLLHERELGEEAMLALCSTHNGLVALQVAGQVEQRLRARATAESQVKLLWSLLQRRPHPHLFRELLDLLRGEEGERTPLHALTEAVRLLDEHRQKGGAVALVARDYRKLAEATATLLTGREGEGIAPATAIRQVAEELARAGQLLGDGGPRPGDPTWRRMLRGVVLGGDEEQGGLDDWMRWLGLPVADLERLWAHFDHALARVHDAAPAVSREQLEELEQSLAGLRGALGRLAWPEAMVVGQVLAPLDPWLQQLGLRARASARAAEAVDRLLERGDEGGLLALVADEAQLALLPAEALGQTSRFLLDHLLLRAAARLRVQAGHRAALPSLGGFLSPLIGGVVSGPLLVLDVGTAFNEALLVGSVARWLAMTLFFLVLSFVLLASDLASRLVQGGLPWWRRALRVGARVTPLYLGALGLAFSISLLVLWGLEGTSIRPLPAPGAASLPLGAHAFLWTGLSLFLGLFLGLLLQGKRFVED